MVKPVFHFSLLFLEHSGTANDMDTIEYAMFRYDTLSAGIRRTAGTSDSTGNVDKGLTLVHN